MEETILRFGSSPVCCRNVLGDSLVEIGIAIGIAIAIGIGIDMVSSHQQLDVYRLSIGDIAWDYEK